MPETPHFASPLDSARFLVGENRLHELWFDELSPDEREVVILDLKAELSRVRRRALRSHLIGATLTACFLGLGVAVMAIGPAEFLGAFDGWLRGTTIPSVAAVWVPLVLFASRGAFAADYVLRRRLGISRLWDHESASIRKAIQRGEAWHPSSQSSSSESDVSSSEVDDLGPVHVAVATLREHLHGWRSHYLIERLSDVAHGGPLTAEAREALRAASQHLREECGAHAAADALQQWTEIHHSRKN